MEVRPTVKTASIFLPDEVSLLNKVDFNLYSQIIAVDAKRKKEADALQVLTTEANHVNVYAAGGKNLPAGTASGSVIAGSTLELTDLLAARTILSTGSDPSVPNYVLCYPEQYENLNSNDALSPGATSPGAFMRKSTFDANGDLMRFAGMDIYQTELIRSAGSTSLGADDSVDAYTVLGHPAIVGKKGWSIGRGEKIGITIHSQDDRIRHGTYKVVDMAYDHTILVQESMILIRCADA